MSSYFLRAGLASLAAGVLLQSAGVRAESFEVVNYTPPRGWPVQNLPDGKAYVRPDKNGIITFYAGRFDNPEVAFVVTWRELVEPVVPGPAPTPQLSREGEFSVASGAVHGRFNGKDLAVSMVTITGRGRRLGIVSIASSDEARRELTAFFASLALAPAAVAPAPDPPASGLVGRWWKDAGNYYYWYEFSDNGVYSYEAPLQERRTGTFRVQGNRITFTDSTGRATSRIFRFECVGGAIRLEIDGEAGYWSVLRRC